MPCLCQWDRRDLIKSQLELQTTFYNLQVFYI